MTKVYASKERVDSSLKTLTLLNCLLGIKIKGPNYLQTLKEKRCGSVVECITSD